MSGIANFRGMALPYTVIDGMAVHAGDIVLGPTIDLEPAPSAVSLAPGLDPPTPRHLAPQADEFLWPNGIIPYVIDAEVPPDQADKIRAAIREWNEKTVISLQVRTEQADYVRFRATDSGWCRADVGMSGGEQGVYLPPGGCSVSALIHEIGHSVGLYHEHQRQDRDAHVMVFDENLTQWDRKWYSAVHFGTGPYDYASAMHYATISGSSKNGRHYIETIPPGLPVSSTGLSQGDVDGVARLYRQNPTATTISTNPEGLEIVLDGHRVVAPVKMDWVAGSRHVIEAPVAQADEGSRYLFGTWSDGGDRRHEFTASAETTWIEANFIVQHSVASSVTPARSGSVAISPHSPDGYYTFRAEVEAVATAARGGSHSFLWWKNPWAPWPQGVHGRNSNPASAVIEGPGKLFDAVFTDRPRFRIETGGPIIRIDLDDTWDYGPTVRLADTADRQVRIEVAELPYSPWRGQVRYRFRGWSDGGSRARTVTIPPQGGSIRANLEAEFPLSTAAADPGAGAISVDPPSSDGYYAAGTTVRLTATASPGWEFVGWTADATSREQSVAIEMGGPRHVEAMFSQTSEIAPGTSASVILPSTNSTFKVHDRQNGFRVHVPHGVAELTIGFESTTPGAEVDLFVTSESEALQWKYEADGETPRFEAGARSVLPGSSEQVVISLGSEAPLASPRIYFVSLVVHSPQLRIEGVLRADITNQATARPVPVARPRALTFVAPLGRDAAPQIIQLRNVGDAIWRYRIDSDQAWLAAAPGPGTVPARASVPLSVSVSGAGMRPDTHGATLRLVPLDQADAVSLPAVEIPVTFVAVPDATAASGGSVN